MKLLLWQAEKGWMISVGMWGERCKQWVSAVSHCSTLSESRFPFHSLLLFAGQLAISLSASRYVWLIASLLVLITHPSAHCLGCRELTEAVLPFEENIAQRHINAEPELNVWHYNDSKKLKKSFLLRQKMSYYSHFIWRYLFYLCIEYKKP